MAHCDDNLTKIAQAIKQYQKQNDNQNPPTLESLVEQGHLSPWDIICPTSHFTVGQSAYTYRGQDLYASAPDHMIIAHDKHPTHKNRYNILFANSQIKRPPQNKFQQLIQKDNQTRTQLALPPKPA